MKDSCPGKEKLTDLAPNPFGNWNVCGNKAEVGSLEPKNKMDGISFVGKADVAEMSLLAAQKYSSWLVCDGFFLCCLPFGFVLKGTK